MRRRLGAILAGCAILANGCVSLPTQQDRLADLQESRNRSARSAAEIAALEQERLRFLEELAVIRTGRETALSDLELHRHYLANEQQILNQIESRFTALRNDSNKYIGSAIGSSSRSKISPCSWRRSGKTSPTASNR